MNCPCELHGTSACSPLECPDNSDKVDVLKSIFGEYLNNPERPSAVTTEHIIKAFRSIGTPDIFIRKFFKAVEAVRK